MKASSIYPRSLRATHNEMADWPGRSVRRRWFRNGAAFAWPWSPVWMQVWWN